MFFNVDIRGDALPHGTLCLTYDDGPGETRGEGSGPRTRELGEYLSEWGVGATFFVIGRHLEQHRDVVVGLKGCGHLVGNHTYSHPGLVALAKSGGDVVGELTKTDVIIRESISQPVTFFRAPYGNWRETLGADRAPDRPTSVVAEILNRCDALKTHVGPVNWDISGHDYDYWESGRPAEQCAREYLERIERIGRGIVLLHDSSDQPSPRSRNQTLALTRLLVPTLVRRGYRFVRLDEIAQAQSAARVSEQLAIMASNGRFLSTNDRGAPVVAGGTVVGTAEQFGVVDLGHGSVAYRASDGTYLSYREQMGEVVSGAATIGDRELFVREARGERRFTLRLPAGPYLGTMAEDGTVRIPADASTPITSFTGFNLFNDVPWEPSDRSP
jgi:peptidoglycan/xylan/chitin deacetylase (PgdA/CDA1 family)